MEIKVICECGTKYKFEVQPVDGHMPQAVKCPACGANGTAQANAFIREALGIAHPPPVQTAAAPAPVPVATVASAPPVAKPPVVRLNVQRPAAAAESHGDAVTVASFRPGAAAPVAAEASAGAGAVWAARGKKMLQLAWKGLLLLLCGLAMLIGFGGKKGRGLRSVVRLASVVLRANAADDDEMKNLWLAEDGVALLIKHANESDVAEACTSYWQDTHKKKITFVSTNVLALVGENENDDHVVIMPAYHGCVQMVGGVKWPKEDFEKLAEFLSQKLNTVSVATRDSEASGGYIFGVFESGEKKFHAEMEIKGGPVTVEGEQWARDHGYKPGKKGFNGFHLADGDRITQKLGFDIEGAGSERVLLLTEVATPPPAPTTRAVTNRVAANRPATNRAPTRATVPAQPGKAR